jgi:antibiotic biosynthesis monooxygenase (ABM) superfamily enzyme
MKEALPQMIFIVVLVINLITSLIDSDRNSKASLIATIILVALTYWGGFYKPLFDFWLF